MNNRLYDLMDIAYSRGICTYTDFMDLSQLSEYRRSFKDSHGVTSYTFSVFKYDERRLISFVPEEYESFDEASLKSMLPLDIIKITPSFSSQVEFNHRDLLGSLMGLSIDRKVLGDMIITDSHGYIQCLSRMSSIITDELRLVKQQTVTTELVDILSVSELMPKVVTMTNTVASLRIDNIVKLLSNTSRSNASDFIVKGNVKVNQMISSKSHSSIADGDIISIRGVGKFKIIDSGTLTKKGRISLTYHKYI